MALINPNYKCNCVTAAIIASVIVGVFTAFFQITAVITVSSVFLLVAFGIAIVYLAILIIAAALTGMLTYHETMYPALNALLVGILGTILLSLLLLAVGIVATSVLSAVLLGLLLFFFTLTLTSSACFIRSLIYCRN